MNERLLKYLYEDYNLEQFGSYEKFRKDMEDENIRKGFFDHYLAENGKYEDFDRDINMTEEDMYKTVEEPAPEEANLLFGDSRFGKTWVGDWMDDVWTAIKKGQDEGQAVGETMTMMMSGMGASDKEVREYVDAALNARSVDDSDEFREFLDKGGFKSAKGWMTFLKNSLTIVPELVTKSLSSMVSNEDTGSVMAAGAAVSAATGGAGALIAMPIAAGVSSGMLETTGKYSEMLQEEIAALGLPFDENSVRFVLEDEETMDRIIQKSLAKGIPIGMVDAITGMVAGGIGAKAVRAGLSGASKAKAVAKAVGVEAAGGGVGEAVGEIAAGEPLDATSIGLEAFAEIGSGAGNVITPYITERRSEKQIEQIRKEQEATKGTSIGEQETTEDQPQGLPPGPETPQLPPTQEEETRVDDGTPEYTINNQRTTRDNFLKWLDDNPNLAQDAVENGGSMRISVRNDPEAQQRLNEYLGVEIDVQQEEEVQDTTPEETTPDIVTREVDGRQIAKVGDRYFRVKKDGTPSKVEIKNEDIIQKFDAQVDEKEFTEIIEDQVINDPRLAGIADKINNGQELTQEEDFLFLDNIEAVNDIIAQRQEENQITNQNQQTNEKEDDQADADSQEGADNRTEAERQRGQQSDGGQPSGQAPQVRDVQIRKSKRGQREFDIDGKTFTLINQGKGQGWTIDGIDGVIFSSLTDAKRKIDTDNTLAQNITENANEVVEQPTATAETEPATVQEAVSETPEGEGGVQVLEEVVPDQEYNDYKGTLNISEERANSIREKFENDQQLTEREQEMFNDIQADFVDIIPSQETFEQRAEALKIPQKDLKGDVALQVQDLSTGETTEQTLNAKKAHTALRKEVDKLKKLRNCLTS